jgi:hypothetical protein
VGFFGFLVLLISAQYFVHLCKSLVAPVHPPYDKKGALPGKPSLTKRP